jgi:hypothetical protein
MEVFSETFQTIQVNLFDLTGRKLANIYDGTIVPGANLIEFSKPAQIKAGVYQMVSTVNGQAITQSIVIE